MINGYHVQINLDDLHNERALFRVMSEIVFSILQEFPIEITTAMQLEILNNVIGAVCALCEKAPDEELYRLNRQTIETSYKWHTRVFAEAESEGHA